MEIRWAAREVSTMKGGAVISCGAPPPPPHELFCAHRHAANAAATATAATATDDDEACFSDEGEDDDDEYPPDAKLALALARGAGGGSAVYEHHHQDLTLTQWTLAQKTETEPGDANLSNRTRALDKTIALVKHEENPANQNGVNDDDEVSFTDGGDDDDKEYPTDAQLALALGASYTHAMNECHRHDLTLTQSTLAPKTETESGDANFSTRTGVLETTIALVKHEENPAKLNGVKDDDEVSFTDGGDDDDEEYLTDSQPAFAQSRRSQHAVSCSELATPCTRAVHERHRHNLTLTQSKLLAQKTETEPGDANLSTRVRAPETTIALVTHEENPAKLNEAKDDDEVSFTDGGDDDDEEEYPSISGSEFGTPSRSAEPRRKSKVKWDAVVGCGTLPPPPHELFCAHRRAATAVSAAAAAATDDDKAGFTDEGENPAKWNGFEEEGGDDDDLTRPEAGDADAAAAPPAQPALAHRGNARLHSLYEQGHELQQRRLREVRERDQKPWAASATKEAYAASDRITHLYEKGRAQLQKAALSEVRSLSFAHRIVSWSCDVVRLS